MSKKLTNCEFSAIKLAVFIFGYVVLCTICIVLYPGSVDCILIDREMGNVTDSSTCEIKWWAKQTWLIEDGYSYRETGESEDNYAVTRFYQEFEPGAEESCYVYFSQVIIEDSDILAAHIILLLITLFCCLYIWTGCFYFTCLRFFDNLAIKHNKEFPTREWDLWKRRRRT